MTHTQETRQKISTSLKATHQRKREDASPTRQRMVELASSFAQGHPDGLQVSWVVNHGDMGRDVEAVKRGMEESSQIRSTRLEEFKARNEGVSGGQVKPPVAVGRKG